MARSYNLNLGARETPAAPSAISSTTARAAVPRSRDAAPPSRSRALAAPGLSKSHNRTTGQACISERRKISVHHGAGLLLLESRPREGASDFNEGHQRPRGEIKSWSKKSRMNCRRLLHSLRRDSLVNAWFITTTYPAVFPAPDDHSVYKSHLHRLCQEVRRRHPKVSGVWKLEFQQRLAAHFHFLLIGCPEEIISFRVWIAHTWARIVNSGDPNHEAAGTGVDRIRTYGGVMAYVTSYISKEDQTLPGNFTGRYWGIINREHLPVVEATEYEVSDKGAVRINRWVRTLTRKYQEQSRWKTWAKLRSKLHRNSHWISRTEFEHVWSQRTNKPHPSVCDVKMSKGTFYLLWTELLPQMSNGSKLRPPRRIRQWNNSGGTLLCNASAFWSAVERGIERGII